jgi:trimethylamine--corrinoid protein Co-methyltransferase
MRPKLELLDHDLVNRILGEAFELLDTVGVKVGSPEALDLLASAGARINGDVAHLPTALVRRTLDSVPRQFDLYDRAGQPRVHYGGDDVNFDPGSSCLNILDAETGQSRPALSSDLVRMIQVTEMLPEYTAQSTAMVCNDVPSEIGDWYRLLLVLWYSDKPIVTGAFSIPNLRTMFDLLAADAGGSEALKEKPRAIFDVCPSPPLNWSEFASQNMIELARAGVPAEIVSMPLAGATAPVTLVGSIVQHAAECLAGICIHQSAKAGSPVVWGGAPAIFDMATGNAPMGAIETVMLNLGCAQVGKSLGLPTHGYMVASDARRIDAQAGMESGGSALLGALSGINMISGAGMLDFLATHSIEKLVIDADAIANAQRLLAGIEPRTEKLAMDMFAQTGIRGDFLKLKETRALFRKEQHFPSGVIDRSGDGNGAGILARVKGRIDELLVAYQRPRLSPEVENALLSTALRTKAVQLDRLPGIEVPSTVVE